MLPVTGPTVVTVNNGYLGIKVMTRYKQEKPYNLLLPYKLHSRFVVSVSAGGYPNAGSYGSSLNSPVDMEATGDAYYSNFTTAENNAIAKAIKKFNSLQGARASLGIALAEARQSGEMFVKRFQQLVSVAKSLKRFDLKGASEALGLRLWQAKRKHREWARAGKRGPYSLRGEDIWSKTWDKERTSRRRAQAFADLWLEFSFGWMPLVDDVHTAVGVLTKKPDFTKPMKAGGTVDCDYNVSSITGNSTYEFAQVGRHDAQVRCTLGGVLTATNPNYGLAARLGLTNPATVAYELVTFSFILNYFVNIEEFISQFSQYHGVTVSQAWYTIVWDDAIDYKRTTRIKPAGATTVDQAYVMRAVGMKRVIGSLPSVKLGLRPSYHNGVKRAFNNAALLVQLLQRNR